MASEVTEATPNIYLVMLEPRSFASRGVKGCSKNWLIEWRPLWFFIFCQQMIHCGVKCCSLCVAA